MNLGQKYFKLTGNNDSNSFVRSPSAASMSTRVSSSNSLVELDLAQDALSRCAKPRAQHRVWPKVRKICLAAVCSALAMLWQRHVLRRSRDSRPWGPIGIAKLLLPTLAAYTRLSGLRAGRNDFNEKPERVPRRQSLICLHPHGAYLQGLGAHVIGELRGNPDGAFKDVHILTADPVFMVPLFREICLMLNMRPATNRVMDKLMSAGCSVGLCPGGIHEQVMTDPKCEQLFFAPNLGFVRTAMKYGVALVPLYKFGENQLFNVPLWSRQMSLALKKSGIGFTLGLGRWNLPMLPIPTVTLETRLGRAIEVGPANPNPSDAEVESIFFSYCAELHRLFAENKSALPADVAARGLSLVWRGHETVDLSADAFGSGPIPAPTVSAEEPFPSEQSCVTDSSCQCLPVQLRLSSRL